MDMSELSPMWFFLKLKETYGKSRKSMGEPGNLWENFGKSNKSIVNPGNLWEISGKTKRMYETNI